MAESSMSAITRHPLYRVAKAECDKLGIADADGFWRTLASLSKDQFLREIEPWNRHRLVICNLKSPVYKMVGGKLVFGEYIFSELEKESLRLIDEAISEIAKKYIVGENG